MILPPQYISVAANFDPGTRLLYLDVVHLANDPVTGPVQVYASFGGRGLAADLPRSRFVDLLVPVPAAVKKVSWRVGVENLPGAFREEIETAVAAARGGHEASGALTASRMSSYRTSTLSRKPRLQGRDDRVGVVDAAAPGAAADGLQGGPEAGVVGQLGVGREVGVGRRGRRGRGRLPRRRTRRPSSPTRSIVPSRRTRSTTIRIRSPSRTRPIGPPARASGPTWPMQAPVETPENRASVITAICLPNERCFRAEVIW